MEKFMVQDSEWEYGGVYSTICVAERRYGNWCGAAEEINNNIFLINVGACAISITEARA